MVDLPKNTRVKKSPILYRVFYSLVYFHYGFLKKINTFQNYEY